MAKQFIFSEWKNIFYINVRVCVTSRYTAARGQSVRRRSSRSVSRYGPTLTRDADRGRFDSWNGGTEYKHYSAIYTSHLLECHSQSVLLLFSEEIMLPNLHFLNFFLFTNNLSERKLKSNIKIIHIHNCIFFLNYSIIFFLTNP